MLVSAYVFALVIGGVLLLASIFLGSHGAHGGATGADHTLDDNAVEQQVLDKEVFQDQFATDVGSHGAFDTLLNGLRSFRFWIFFCAFFGLTGVVLELLSVFWPITFVLAVLMGAAAAWGMTGAFQFLGRTSANSAPSAADYIGKTARVMVAFDRNGQGKVRIELKGNTIDLLARTDEVTPLEIKEDVVIVGFEDTTARVMRYQTRLRRG